MAEKLLIRY